MYEKMTSNEEKEALEREKGRLRVQKHRNKLKLDQEAYTNHLKKDAERKNQERAKQKKELMAEGSSTKRGKIAIELKRLKETERKRKYRQKKKEQSLNKKCDNVLGSFSSVQSLGKAFSRVKKVLPKSPSKKLAVVKKLVYATTQLPESQRKALFNEVSKVKITAVSKETEEKVHAFFCRDDISRMAPGKRDCKTVKNKYSGNKEKHQKRHMVMTVKEAYSLFIGENPAISLKKSKFYELRPKHLLESRWSSVQAIPEIQSKHYFRASSFYAGSIVAGRTVNSELSLSELWKDNEEAESLQSDSELNEFDTSPQSSSMAQRKRVRYSEVYSDSENEEQYLLAKPVPKSEVKTGQFILIELVSVKKGRRQKYVGITQTCVDEDNNVEVIYMNTVCGKKSEQLFKIEHSKSYIVSFAEVCGVLKSPEIKETGNRIFYKFEKPIEL